MNNHSFSRVRRFGLGLLMFALPMAVSAPSALAQAAKIFVASTGSDANVGNSVSPKRTFQAAHDAVAAGGEIVVLDTAGYGLLTITKSVTLTVPPGVNAFSTATTDVNNITVNASVTDVVSIRGLIVEGFGPDNGDDAVNGYCILVNSVGTLRVEDCTLRNFYQGIAFNPSNAAHLLVSGCSFQDLYEGTMASLAGGQSDVIITDCKLDAIGDAAIFAGFGSSTSVAVVTAARCLLTNCGDALDGDNTATLFADRCTFSGDQEAVGTTGATLTSFGNNTFTGNVNNGSFGSTQALQ